MSDLDFSSYEPEPEQKPKPNRAFGIVAGILGAIILIALIAAAAYAILIMPRQNAANAQKAIQINAQNTATVMAATSVFQTETAPTNTPEPTATEQPTSTPEPTATESIPPTDEALAVGGEALPEDQAMTATVAVLLTQAAGGKPAADAEVTLEPGTTPEVVATALPTTGFADEVGLPAMMILGAILLGVILITRQIRLARSR